MNNNHIGYGVFQHRVNPLSDTSFDSTLISAIFHDAAQAENALIYCNTKRADTSVFYEIGEIVRWRKVNFTNR